jgi:hypothetical protein
MEEKMAAVTDEEVEAEVAKLRADMEEVARLMAAGTLRPVCFEDDLRAEAHNRLTKRKTTG